MHGCEAAMAVLPLSCCMQSSCRPLPLCVQVVGRAHATPGFAENAMAAEDAYRTQADEAAAAVRAASAALGVPLGARLTWRGRPDPAKVRRRCAAPLPQVAGGGAEEGLRVVSAKTVRPHVTVQDFTSALKTTG